MPKYTIVYTVESTVTYEYTVTATDEETAETKSQDRLDKITNGRYPGSMTESEHEVTIVEVSEV